MHPRRLLTARLAMLALGLLALAYGPSARADSACGPGQRMVGEHSVPGAAGTAPMRIPVCAPDNSSMPSGEAAAPEIPNMPLNAALAWGNLPDGTPAYFYVTARLNSWGAMKEAVAGCEAYGARNCREGLTVANGWLGISKAADGSFFAAFGRKKKQAEKAALERCAREASGCTVAETIRTG
ncbi:DUF4189 domain-containing protein [Altererythrobacter sp. BO-6]|uniref:DUF4189 domain-containing protein n=1 Tax=Altererythrobacter sp. BO-6 TaxID=2604537 RepID=UPI0013E15563|nr:DUF4189 domain-containing protein [Altererythrobacter sp. BO-6]QIG54543.1 DUF4189 domain-containing protein [Altererythrobacter sp. BO-6]